jgi:hypothetical protein
MKARDYLVFGGIELANENRTSAYASLVRGVALVSEGCGCSVTDEGPYSNPEDDDAPWVDPARSESFDFLGMIAHDIRIDPIPIRSVTPRARRGATIGSLRLRHRILSVTAALIATSSQGMAYGERWVSDVLSGVIIGCAPDEIRLLLACPEDAAVAQFRTLRRVGIVDGPTSFPIAEMPECYVQSITFQIAAGIPHLLTDAEDCLVETILVGGS